MKYLTIIFLSTCLLAGQTSFAEPEKKEQTYKVIQSKDSFFSSLWSKIKRVIPQNQTSSNTATAVIGVRGKETTESALQPHWEGDLANNPEFRNDVKQFEDATSLCESSTPDKGSDTFEQLLETSTNDMLKANTLIALASCYARQGNEEKGREHLNVFLNKFPKHPMYDEINTWLSANK